jgi:hypothetical protein
MATDTLPKGRTITILSKDESTLATLPSGNWIQTVAYGPITLGEKQGFEDDPILGAGLVNTVDTSQPAPALPSAGGNIMVPLDLSHAGYWLKRAFGAPSTSGAPSDYTHAFASGAESLPTFAVELKKGSALFYDTLGCAVNRLTFNASRKAGYDRFGVEIIAVKEAKNTSSQGGTPAAMVARAPVAAALPVFKLNGTLAGQVLAIDAAYDNKLIGQDFISGDAHIAGIERDAEATFTGTLRVRFKDATYHDLGISGATFSGELLWQVSSVRSLSLLAPLMRIERTPIEVQGPGGIDVSFPFRCEADATNPMLTATLKSAVATF